MSDNENIIANNFVYFTQNLPGNLRKSRSSIRLTAMNRSPG